MSELPLVSIVTPSYNQAPFLQATIRSVLDQDYPRIEYLIMDGGSGDGSVEIIRRYEQQLAAWVSEPDAGQAAAINKGLRRATGSVLGWLNSDDTLLPGAVSRVVAAMADGPAVVHGAVRLIDEAGQAIPRPKLSKRQREFGLPTVVDDGLVNQPGTFWHRSLIEQVGWLDESLRYVMDYEYWTRLALAGARFVRLPDPPLATYRLTRDTKTVAGMYGMGLEQLAVFDRLLADPGLAGKMGVTPVELDRMARRAKGLASLKVARGTLRLPGHRREALGWLLRAARLYPRGLLLVPEYLIKKPVALLAHRLGRETGSW